MDLTLKSGEDLFQFLILAVLVVFTLILLVVVLNIYVVLKRLVADKDGSAVEAGAGDFSLWKGLTDAVPLDKEETIMLDHNYDGIRELDNHLPPWWIGLFYGTIIFAIIYGFNYHWFGWSPLSGGEYEQEVATAQKQIEEFQAKNANSIDEKTVKVLTDANTLGKGKEIFTGKCAACHGAAGEGGVGPNLTDEYWLHGGTINDVFATIKNGVPDKGMISWKATLKPNEIQNVANYILSIQGTNPANAKAPQGEKAGGAAPAAADSTASK